MQFQSLSRPGSSSEEESNEDEVTVSQNTAWVLDGTSGFTDKKVSDRPTDGRWYVEEFDSFLRSSRLNDFDQGLKEVFKEGITEVSEAFERRLADSGYEGFDHEEYPSANIAGLRWDDERLEVFNLGDCTALVKREEDVSRVRQEAQVEMDNKITEKLGDLMDKGLNHEKAMNEVHSDLVEDERRRNYDYFSLGHVPEAAEEITLERYSRDNVEAVLLYTDGFEILHQYVSEFEDEDFEETDLIEYVAENGLKDAVEKLRNYEDDVDPNCEQIPRFKKSDDVAVAYLVFE